MKTYNEFVNEFFSFKKTYKNIERSYPGAFQFVSVANKYAARYFRFENDDLKKILKLLMKRNDIGTMKKRDWKHIYEFIRKYKLFTLDDIRNVFIDTKDFTERLPNIDTERLPNIEGDTAGKEFGDF